MSSEYGTYTLEVHLLPRTVDGVYPALLRFWLNSGSFGSLHTMLHICRNCKQLLMPHHLERTFCFGCGAPIKEVVVDGRLLDGSLEAIADALAKEVFALDFDCSIMLTRAKYTPEDLIRLNKEQMSVKQQEKLSSIINDNRDRVLYTRSRLLKDKESGADLLKLIKAFLSA